MYFIRSFSPEVPQKSAYANRIVNELKTDEVLFLMVHLSLARDLTRLPQRMIYELDREIQHSLIKGRIPLDLLNKIKETSQRYCQSLKEG